MRFGRIPFIHHPPSPEEVLAPEEIERLTRERIQYMLAGRLDLSRREACRWVFARWLAQQGVLRD